MQNLESDYESNLFINRLNNLEKDLNAINTLRLLSVDMIENSKSGHPGMPLGCSPLIYILFKYFLNFTNEDLDWINRDRFILSNGHGCALLYSILHLLKFDITLDDLKNFRKINSKTPGHPEVNKKLNIDVTTGPLGQGISNAVGMALASKKFKEYNNDINNKIYVMCGDGCLMEGISYESISLAGHLKLNNLILIYDNNGITIDGKTDLTISENQESKFKSMGWNVLKIENADTDLLEIFNSFSKAYNSDLPTLIIANTSIGYASDKQNSEKSHGSPLGEESVKNLKIKLGFDPEKKFYVSDEIKNHFEDIILMKNSIYRSSYIKKNPFKNLEFNFNPLDLTEVNEYLQKYKNNNVNISTRKLSGELLKIISDKLLNVIVGSADLSESNCFINVRNSNDIIKASDFTSNYLHYGIREHAMCGIANGLSTFDLVPIVGTFLVFISYCLGAIRLSALSGHKVIYVLTHDSIGLGEDGPTHQPIESLTILRSIPNLLVFRPANHMETLISYKIALEQKDTPSCICLSRQNVLSFNTIKDSNDELNKLSSNGAYIYYSNIKEDNDLSKSSFIILISTGSELELCKKVAEKLCEENKIQCKVISMLSTELYDKTSESFKSFLLPKEIKKISIEAGSTLGWFKYANHCIGIDQFGKSGKGNEVMEDFGFSVEKLQKKIIFEISKN